MAGKEEFAEQNKQSNQSPWSFNSNAQQQAQPTAVHRTISMGQTHYAFSHQSDDRASDPSDQPLDFAPGFIRDRDLVQSACSQNSGVYVGGTDSPAMGSIHSLKATAAPGVAYPPLHAPGPQVWLSFIAFFCSLRSFLTILNMIFVKHIVVGSFFGYIFTCSRTLWTTVWKNYWTKPPASGPLSQCSLFWFSSFSW